jgi:ADP-ribosylglycohydrolase
VAKDIVLAEPTSPGRLDVVYERIAGALLGGAIADALGWPTEFARSESDLERMGVPYPIKDFVPWHKRSGGRFFTRLDNIQPGEYSDDTQLTLAVIRSLAADGTVDNAYFARQELSYWLAYARGAGATVTAAARAASRQRLDWRWNYFRFTRGRHESDYREAGANGAAMRAGPIALANLVDPQRCFVEIWKNAIVTHGHPRAILGALVFGEALRRTAEGHELDAAEFIDELGGFVASAEIPAWDEDVAFWLQRWDDYSGPPFRELWEDARSEVGALLKLVIELRSRPLREAYLRLGCFEPATKGSGTNTVAAALTVFLAHGRSYRSAALAAANELGSDTDTIGAMAGQLVGAWLGFTQIPEEWATLMADYSYFAKAAEVLTRITLRRAEGNRLRLADAYADRRAQDSILVQLSEQAVRERHKVWHPLLGEGWVMKVESQQVGNGRGRVLMATVKFDIGQTCKFTSYQGLRRSQPKKQQPPQSRLELD